MIDAQQKYLTKQQTLAKAKAKSTKLVLTKMPTSTRPCQLAQIRRCPKEFGLGIGIVYKTSDSAFSSFVGATPVSNSVLLSSSTLISGDAPMSSFSFSVGSISLSSVALVSSYSFFIGRTPGSVFSSFVDATIVSSFPLHNSSRFSTLDVKLQQTN